MVSTDRLTSFAGTEVSLFDVRHTPTAQEGPTAMTALVVRHPVALPSAICPFGVSARTTETVEATKVVVKSAATDVVVSRTLLTTRRLTSRRLCTLIGQTAVVLPTSKDVSHVSARPGLLVFLEVAYGILGVGPA